MCLDVALLDYILQGHKVNFAYVILRHMLNIPTIINWFIPFDGFINRIFKYFRVPINEPTFEKVKKLRDDVILSLGFD